MRYLVCRRTRPGRSRASRPRQRGPPCARYLVSGSAHFTMPIPARTGDCAVAGGWPATSPAWCGGIRDIASIKRAQLTSLWSPMGLPEAALPPRALCQANVPSVTQRPSPVRLHPCVWFVETLGSFPTHAQSSGEPSGLRSLTGHRRPPLTCLPAAQRHSSRSLPSCQRSAQVVRSSANLIAPTAKKRHRSESLHTISTPSASALHTRQWLRGTASLR